MDSAGFEIPYWLCTAGFVVVVVLLFAMILCQDRDHHDARQRLLEVLWLANLKLKARMHLALVNCNELRTQLQLSLRNCVDLRLRLNQATGNCHDLRQQLNQAVRNSTRLRRQRNARRADLLEARENLQRKEVALQVANTMIEDLVQEKADLIDELARATHPEIST